MAGVVLPVAMFLQSLILMLDAWQLLWLGNPLFPKLQIHRIRYFQKGLIFSFLFRDHEALVPPAAPLIVENI